MIETDAVSKVFVNKFIEIFLSSLNMPKFGVKVVNSSLKK
jgi:hypothetical protein